MYHFKTYAKKEKYIVVQMMGTLSGPLKSTEVYVNAHCLSHRRLNPQVDLVGFTHSLSALGIVCLCSYSFGDLSSGDRKETFSSVFSFHATQRFAED